MKHSIKSLVSTLFLLLPLLQVACSPTAKLTAPAGFAHIAGDYDDRITSARGVVIGARVESNEPRANLAFWVEAIDLRLQQRGYVTTGTPADVRSKTGLVGKALRYNVGTKKYWVDVYVAESRLVLVEATGRAQDLESSRLEVESAMREVRTN